MRSRPGVQQAFDEARYGASRTLNVREPMLSGAEAVRRTDGWLRSKQVELTGEVLIITGRGAGSDGQVPVVREEVRKLLNRLRRSGVVGEVREHTPGSFAVELAPLRALFDAPRRTRRGTEPPRLPPAPSGVLDTLEPGTRDALRRLAHVSLESLGMRDPDEGFIATEMERKFSLLVRGAGDAPLSDAWLRSAIERALEEYEELHP